MTTNSPENSDRELLGLAAKAAGIVEIQEIRNDGAVIFTAATMNNRWDPLNDDGDALRLAVKLDMIIDIDTGECATSVDYTTLSGDLVLREGHRFDPYVATRRAIVRAAAEMGTDKTGMAEKIGTTSTQETQ